MLGLGLLGAALYPFFEGLRKRMRHMCPVLGVATLSAGIWELVTSCLGLLPLPYFQVRRSVWEHGERLQASLR